MTISFLSSFIIPVILTILITPRVIKFALQIGAVDEPGGRKIHDSITPRLGGLAVIGSIGISLVVLMLFNPALFEGIQEYAIQSIVFGISLIVIFLLGFWDDLSPLNSGIKFGIQFIVAALIYYAGFKISNVTNPFGGAILDLQLVNFPLTLLWIVGITNAFNLIDGLDGLASGVATIACISIFIISAWAGEIWTATLALIFAGALTGFLRYNFSPAKIFLGDSGSLMIGFGLAILSIQTTTKISTSFALLFPVLVLGLPITDTLISMIRRFLRNYLPGEPSQSSKSIKSKLHDMFVADRSHIHHRLISLGLTHRNTVLLLYLVSALFAVAGIVITQVESFERSIGITIICALALFLGIKQLRYREIAIFNNGMMLPIYERLVSNKGIFLSLIDLIFIAASYTLSYQLIHSLNPSATEFLNFSQTLAVVLTVQLFAFWISGLYRQNIRQIGLGNVIRMTASVFCAVIFTAGAFLIADTFSFVSGIQFLVLDFYLLLTFILGVRIMYQLLGYWVQRYNKSGKNVLIYGANENSTMILHKINNSQNNFKVLGFLDEKPELKGKRIYGYPIFGGYQELSNVLRTMKVDYVFICENDIESKRFVGLRNLAQVKGIEIKSQQINLTHIFNASDDEEPTMQTRKNPYF